MSDYYMRNRACGCARCRCRGLVGAAALITTGILFLIQNFTSYDWGDTWPVLLIVIGVFLYISRTASTAGHVDLMAQQPPQAGYPAPPPPPVPPQSPEVKP